MAAVIPAAVETLAADSVAVVDIAEVADTAVEGAAADSPEALLEPVRAPLLAARNSAAELFEQVTGLLKLSFVHQA